jgi:hypothetical protein
MSALLARPRLLSGIAGDHRAPRRILLRIRGHELDGHVVDAEGHVSSPSQVLPGLLKHILFIST